MTAPIDTRINRIYQYPEPFAIDRVAPNAPRLIQSAPPKSDFRISERELYVALVHQKLGDINPRGAKILERDLASTMELVRASSKEDVLSKATDRIMRALVRRGELSHAQSREIRAYALGKAQLDSDRTRLSGDRSGKLLLEALTSVVQNSLATDEELHRFRTQRRVHTSPVAATKGDTPSQVSASSTVAGLDQGFLWKPVSDSTGKLAILLPANLTTQAVQVSVLSPDGSTVLAKGTYSGIGNGGRQHYRFDKPGSSFPEGCIVQITLRDGTHKNITIEHSAQRIESR